MNIILDIDGTFICHDAKETPMARPYLYDFLFYLFNTYPTVSIWTAAGREWFDEVNSKIFKPIIRDINKLLNEQFSFHFVYTRERCTIKTTSQMYTGENGSGLKIYKNLKKVFKIKNFTKHNTIIIDDTPSTFSKNYGNGMHIPEYFNSPEDDILMQIIIFLNIVKEYYKTNKSVLTLHKNNWWK